MFDIGRLVAKLELIGSQQFDQQLDASGKKTDEFGSKAETAGKKGGKLGDSLDQTGKSAADASSKLTGTAKATDQTGTAADQAAPKAKTLREELKGLGQDGLQASTEVGQGLLGVGAGILALSTLAVVKFAEFDQQMSRTKAVIQGTAAENDALAQSAIAAGGASIYTATEAARAQEELAKAGVRVNDILGGGLTGSLALAAAGELDVGEAAELAATAMTQFKLSGADVPHVADLLAAGAGKAQGSVQDLGYALKQSGLVASQMGLSVEETTGTLALFAKAGLLGSDAGTSFRQMLLSLANPTGKANELLQKYNISAYDAQGHFVSMEDLAGQLSTKLGGLEESERNAALATIFGSDAIRAANVLYDAGASGVRQMTDEVNDSGYAARFAAEAQNNLAGDVEKLGGAFDTALIQGGSGANDALRELTQTVTDLLGWFNGLDPAVQQSITTFGLLAGGALVLGGTLMIAVPKALTFYDSLSKLGRGGEIARGGLRGVANFLTGPWGIALGIGAGVLAIFAAEQGKAQAQSQELSGSLDQATGSITGNTRAIIASNLATKGGWGPFTAGSSAADDAKKLGISIGTLTKAIEGNQAAIDEVNSKTVDVNNIFGDEGDWQKNAAAVGLHADEYRDASNTVLGALHDQTDRLNDAKTLYEDTADATGQNAEALDTVAASAQTAADAYLGTNDAASDLTNTLTQLIDKVNEANGVGQDAVSANDSYKQALAGITDEVTKQRDAYVEAGGVADDFRVSIDENTAAGAANAQMFSDVAAKSQDAAKAQYDLDLQTMSGKDATEKYIGALNTGRQALYDQILALTGNADAAQQLTDKVYGIPDSHSTDILMDTAAATAKIDQFVRDLNNIPGRRDVVINQVVQQTGADHGTVGAAYNAAGAIYRPARHFATGGFNENQISQLATAGMTRVWNEESPYEEAYISSNPAYRDRNISILKDRAETFGYALTEKRNGALSGASGGSGGPMRIAGTLDLGGGLTGYVEGVVQGMLDDEADTARRGAQ